jgi:multiple sugar transport system substrate-binding protein
MHSRGSVCRCPVYAEERSMRRTLVGAILVVALVGACSGGSNSSPGGGGASPAGSAGTSPAESMEASPEGSTGASPEASGGASGGTGGDASGWAQTITGDATLSGWQASPDEGKALQKTLDAFATTYPNLKVDYKEIPGDYRTVMQTRFAAQDVPDIFYVNADYAKEWIDQGLLEPLDDYVAKSGFDTSQFFEGYASIFKGQDGKTYGFPKDGNTIALAYNSDLVPTAPKTLDELVQTANSLKGQNGLKAPMCLNPGLDRGLAFLYAQGGSVVSDDLSAEQIDTDASKTAVQWYLDQFKNGLGMTASDLGSSWCGEALGKKQVAMIFEGGWLDPFMTSTYPDVKYAWSEMPTGTSGSPVTISFTVSYSIGADSKNKDQAFAVMSYLTGKEGMANWTEGGVALPARQDVPTPTGKDVLAAGSAYAKPGSGFMPGWVDVQKAFQDEFTSQIQKKTFDAGPVVDKTAAAVTKAINQ